MSKAEYDYNKYFEGRPVNIYWYETDELFMECHSINKAASILGCSSGQVTKCLNNKPKTEGKKALSITSSRGTFYVKDKKVEKNG